MSERTVSVRITGNAADFQAALEAAGVQAKVVAEQITDAFGTTFKAKLDAAFKSLPDLKIDADSSDVDTKLVAIKGEMDDLRNQTIGVDLSDTEALAKIDDLRARLVVIAAESPDIRIKVDAADAIAKLDLVKKAADDASGKSDGTGLAGLSDKLTSTSGDMSKFGSSASDALGPLASMGSYTAILATALIPLAGVATAAGIGFVGMATAAGAALGAFGLAAMPVYSKVSSAITTITADQSAMNSALTASQKTDAYLKMQQDLGNLSPMVRQVADAVITAKQAFNEWDAQFDPEILKAFNEALADVQPLLNDITPLVNAGARAFTDIAQQIGLVAKQPDFKSFISFLAAQAGPAINTLLGVFEQFGQAFGDALQKSGPLIKEVEGGLEGAARAALKWVDGGGFQGFLNWVQKNGPGIVKDVQDIVGAVGKLIVALTPVGERVLTIVDAFARFIKSPIVSAILNFTTHLDTMRIEINLVKDVFRDLSDFFTNTIPHAISVMSGAFTTGFQAVHDIVNTVWHAIDNDVFHPLENFFTAVITPIVNTFKSTWDQVWSVVKSVVEVNWSVIKGIFDAIIITVGVSLGAALHVFEVIWNAVWPTLSHAVVAAWHAIDSDFIQPLEHGFSDIVSFLHAVWSQAINDLHTAWSDVSSWVNANVIQPIVNDFNAIAGFIYHVWSDVTNDLHVAWSTISSWVNANVIQPVVNVFDTLTGGVNHVWSDVVNAIHTAWSDVANWVNSNVVQPTVFVITSIPGLIDHVWTDITSAIHSAWQDIASWVGNNVVEPVLHLFGTIIDGAADAFSWVPVVGGKLSAAKQSFDNFAAGVQQDLNSLHPPPPISISIDTSQAMSAIVSLGQVAATAAAQTQAATGSGFAGFNVQKFATGGIVRQPTLAIVGDAGPEAIIPLAGLATAAASSQGLSFAPGPLISSGGSTDTSSNSGTSSLVVELDGTQIGHLLLPFILPPAYQKRRATGTLQLS